MDYDDSELERNVIDCILYDGSSVKGRVVGCDFDVGITIVEHENPDKYIACTMRPLSPEWKNSNYDLRESQIMFHIVINQIKRKIYNSSAILKMNRMVGNFNIGLASAEVCPFV